MLARIVATKLQLMWFRSRLLGAETYLPGRENDQVSHETIYRSLFISSPWRPEEGIVAAFETYTSNAPFAPSHPEVRRSPQNP